MVNGTDYPRVGIRFLLTVDERGPGMPTRSGSRGVIQRFGNVKRLVEQTLDPMVSAYFKNVGQTRTLIQLIQLIQDRSAIQQASSDQMKEKFAHYNLELEEVLIGTP